MSYLNKNENLYTESGFTSDLIRKRKHIKEERKKWEQMWEDAEQRWQLITKAKDEKWMTNTAPIDTNIAVEGAFSEITDVLFGGDSGHYFGTRKAGDNEGSPLLEELMRVRLDTQINFKKKAQGQYGLRQLIIKGTTVGIVTWKREGSYTLQYKPVLDPVTGQMLNYTVEKIWVDDYIDRPEVEFLPLENVYIETGAKSFEDAIKMYTETVSLVNVKKKYTRNIQKLLETSNPHLTDDEKNQRRRELNLQDIEIRQDTDDVELTHIYKWCKPDQIKKILESQNTTNQYSLTTADFGGLDAVTVVPDIGTNVLQTSTDATNSTFNQSAQPEREEAFYHIVIGNDMVLLQADECEYFIEQDPFFLCTYIPVDGEIYGLGIPYEVKSAQDQIKDIRDMSLDNIKLRLYTPIRYRPLSSASKLTLKIKPMATFPDYTGKDISFLEVPDATQSALARESSLAYQIQEGSHFNKILSGSGQGLPNNTATGASILRSQSSKSFKVLVRWIGENLIEPVLRKVYARDRQFTTPETVGKLLGGDNTAQKQQMQIDWSQINPEMVFKDYEFEWISAMDKVSDELAAQQLKELFPQLLQFPWFNALEGVRLIANRLGIPHKNLFFTPEQMQATLQPGLMDTQGTVPQANGATGGHTQIAQQGMNPQMHGGQQ